MAAGRPAYIWAGSMSTRISAPVSAGSADHRSDSASSVPTARTASHSASHFWTAALCRRTPSASGCDSGNAPLPLAVVATGTPRRPASSSTSSCAPWAPPPSTSAGRRARLRTVAAARRLSGRGRGWQVRRREAGRAGGRLRRQQVERDLDVYGPGPPGAEAGEGTGDRRVDLLDRGDAVAEGGEMPERLALARHLVQGAGGQARVTQRHAGGDDQQRNAVGVGLADRRRDVEQGGPGGGDRDTGAAGGAGVAVRGVPGALFVAGRDVPDAVGREMPVDLQVVRARDAEGQVGAVRRRGRGREPRLR